MIYSMKEKKTSEISQVYCVQSIVLYTLHEHLIK